ncbi:hypothetical protein CEP52_008324 [Fusarium oligoseptatum]|uniref:Hsp70 protein n=1 Tax=Fusarium oligoseptatum TaxID=2604345 RepID=A0A428TIG1_9HYPO|nr:hypothetical protein CEP52_008324 [Fusarium oligoseptatum]
MNNHQPDLCIGVDFGTTYTGVAWSTPKEENNKTNIIKQWPGETEDEEKGPNCPGERYEWREDKKWKLLKLLLVPETHEMRSANNGHGPSVPGTMHEVHKLVTLYLSQIYAHISNEIPELIKTNDDFSEQLKLKTWDSLAIDFIFSTPTLWGAPISHCFKDIISKAGFGEHKLHKVALGLTEPEAAAVFTCQPEVVGKVHKGHVVLSIDAGGGTTDLAFIKATANTADSFTLAEIHPVGGTDVGSTRIDSEFAKLVKDRIKEYPEAQSELPRDFPTRASQSDDFQSCKHKLGSKLWDRSTDDFAIEVTGLEKSYTNRDLGIKQGELFFTRQQLESCFDITLNHIKGLIKRAVDQFEDNNGRTGTLWHVDHIILSGGLGSSDYVLKELTTYFRDLSKGANSCVAGSRVLRTNGNARTVVVEGLLYDRRTKAHALREHIVRANYGIIVEETRPKWPALSRNVNPANTTTDAPDRIRWLVKFGETVQVGKPITVEITKPLEKSDQRKWTEKIVWLGGECPCLPANMKKGLKEGMEVLRSVDIEVRKGTKLSSRRTFMGTTAYHECNFKLILSVGPSGDCDVEVSENVIKLSG